MQPGVIVDIAELVDFNLVERKLLAAYPKLSFVEETRHFLHRSKRIMRHDFANHQRVVGVEVKGVLVGQGGLGYVGACDVSQQCGQ